MALNFLARFRIRADKEDDFIALVRRIEETSRDEPGTLAYKFYRLDEPGMFAVFESFTDEAADIAHQRNPANVEMIEQIIACMDGSYSREYLRDLP